MERFEDALTLLDRGEIPEAAELLTRLAERTPAHATVHVLLAQAHEKQHRWTEALAAWQTAHLLLPDVPLVRQGSLRAARVLAALRTMTGPATSVPPPPPAAPVPPVAPEPVAPDAWTSPAPEPEPDLAGAAWDPAPMAPLPDEGPDAPEAAPDLVFDEYQVEEESLADETDRPEARADDSFPDEGPQETPDAPEPDTFTADTFAIEPPDAFTDTDAGAETIIIEETLDLEYATFEVVDDGLSDEEADGDQAGPGAPEEATAPPDLSVPWQNAADESAHDADFSVETDEDASDDPSPFASPDVFFDPPDHEEAPADAETAGEAADAPEASGLQPDSDGPDLADALRGGAPSGGADPGIARPEHGEPDVFEAPDVADVEAVKGPYEPFDLDDLIASLSGAGRIVPNPEPTPPPPDEDTDLDDMVSPTLARIHAAQGQYEEAARIFDRLAEQDPQRAAEYRAEASALRDKKPGRA